MLKPKAKRKSSAKSRGEALRASDEFLWHLRPPFSKYFDHEPWWPQQDPVPLEGALWEMLRRHPDVQELHPNGGLNRQRLILALEKATRPSIDSKTQELREQRSWELQRLQLLTDCRYLSWPKLSEPHQKLWIQYLREQFPSQHGIDPAAVVVLNQDRLKALVHEHRAKTGPAERLASFRFHSIARLQDGWLENAQKHDKRGHILVAIDPGATLAEIAKRVKNTVNAWKKELQLADPGKDQIDKRLAVIAKFESSELLRPRNEIRDDQLFYQYRKLIKDWSWPF